MAIRITPAVRLSLGLVILMVSILIIAQSLGLAPSADQQQLDLRKNLAESLANQMSVAITRSDDLLLKYYLDAMVEHNPDILSAAVRRPDGLIISETDAHEDNWVGADATKSTPTHVRLPLLINGIVRANVELAFKPIAQEKHPLFKLPKFIVMVIFLSISGFIGFWFYIKRALHHLDPSAVVPTRVRNAMNVLAEGVLILDRREQIVLANSVIQEVLNKSEAQLLGKKASQLGWELATNQEVEKMPWLVSLSEGIKLVGIRVLLNDVGDKPKVFSVNAVPIMDAGNKMQGAIAVFDDVSELEEKSRLLEDIVQQLAATHAAIEGKNKELRYLSERDPLTNCFNRRALYAYLDGNFTGGRAGDAECSCIMADIDFFKRVNDTYGHQVGDEVIKMAASCLQSVVREGDLVARFGGEEFCVILPGAPLSVAVEIAERCRIKISEQICSGVKVTSSFGVTSKLQGATTPNELVHQADEALYYSKQNGRNRVSSWLDMPKTETPQS